MKAVLMKPMLIATTIAMLVGAESAPPPLPSGLWQSKEEGFVIRIEACGQGFCGFAAAAPGDKKKVEEGCGKQMLRNFVWNEKSALSENSTACWFNRCSADALVSLHC